MDVAGVSRGPGERQGEAGVSLSPRERQEWVKAPRAECGVQRCLTGQLPKGHP